MDELRVPLRELWVRLAAKLTTHFRPPVVKRLPTTVFKTHVKGGFKEIFLFLFYKLIVLSVCLFI